MNKTFHASGAASPQTNNMDFTVVYNTSVNTYTITMADASNDAANFGGFLAILASHGDVVTTAWEAIGFKSTNAPVESVNQVLEGKGQVNVSGDDCLDVRTSFGTAHGSMSYETRTRASGDLLARVPIYGNPHSIIHYRADAASFYCRIADGKASINFIQIRLTDSDNNDLLLNGLDWTLTLKIMVYPRPPHPVPHIPRPDQHALFVPPDRAEYRPPPGVPHFG